MSRLNIILLWVATFGIVAAGVTQWKYEQTKARQSARIVALEQQLRDSQTQATTCAQQHATCGQALSKAKAECDAAVARKAAPSVIQDPSEAALYARLLPISESAEQAQRLTRFFAKYFSTGIDAIELQLRMFGQLKRGEHLINQYGRVDLVSAVDKLHQHMIRRFGADPDRALKVAIQNLGSEAGAVFMHWKGSTPAPMPIPPDEQLDE